MTPETVQDIPLSRLAISAQNVRKSCASDAALDELAASIAAHGLLQNLAVRTADEGAFEVIAGGRRLRALQKLASDGVIKKTHPVRCLVGEWSDASEASLAENVVRQAMDPVDEYRAFSALSEKGSTAIEIGRRFGKTERHVLQRMKLGKVAPELLDAYQNGAFDLETLQAFTLSDDHERQRAAWSGADRAPYWAANSVRKALSSGGVCSTSPIARFVGLGVYELAGGEVSRDLFGDKSVIRDVALLNKLAMERLMEVAAEVSQEWAWADAMLENDYTALSRFRRCYPTDVELSAEDQLAYDEAQGRMDEIEDLDPDDRTDEIDAEEAKLGELLDALDAGMEVYSEKDRARAGCIVTVNFDGKLFIHEGLIRSEDDPTDETNLAGEPAGLEALATDPEPQGALGRGQYSTVLAEQLRTVREGIAQEHVAQNTEVALDLLICTLLRGARAAPLAIQYANRDTGDLKAPAKYAELVDAEGDAQFQAVAKVTPEQKGELLAHLVARTFTCGLSDAQCAEPISEAAIMRMEVDFARHWRPTAKNFFGRISKSQALAIAEQVLGADWKRTHAKLKKHALAEALEAAFSGCSTRASDLDGAVFARASKWLPLGFTSSRRT